jgi:uncharacterized membrane protein YidH (DUF202 family)
MTWYPRAPGRGGSDSGEPNRPGQPDQSDQPDEPELDPALFRERTELAWNRTAIAFAALGGALLKTAPAIGFLIFALSVPVFLLGHTVRPGRPGAADPRRRRRSLLLVTVAVTTVSLAALAVALIDAGHHHPPF